MTASESNAERAGRVIGRSLRRIAVAAAAAGSVAIGLFAEIDPLLQRALKRLHLQTVIEGLLGYDIRSDLQFTRQVKDLALAKFAASRAGAE
jgi:hypothetical protein